MQDIRTLDTFGSRDRDVLGSIRPSAVFSYVNSSSAAESRQAAGNARNAPDARSQTLAAADPPATAADRSAAMPATALDAALVLIDKLTAAGISPRLTPIYATKATRCEPWNTGDQTRDDVLRHRAEYRRAIGVGDASGLLVAIDPDSQAAELVATELIGDCPTFRIASPRGMHREFLRGDVLPADLRANLTYSDDRPAEALAHKLDVVTGIITLWRNDKTWLSDPATIAPMPDRLRDAVAGCWSAQQQRKAAEAAAIAQRVTEAAQKCLARGDSGDSGDHDRLRRYADATLAGISRDGAALPDGQRGDSLFKLACRAGKLVGAAWSGVTEADAEAAMMDAADRCGYVQTNGHRAAQSAVLRGIRRGLADPMPEPSDRDLVRASLPPDRLREIERRAAAAADNVLSRARSAGIHPARAEVCRRLSAELAQRCVDQVRVEVAASVADLGLAIDCDKMTVSRAAQAMLALGWSIVTGKLGADGRATATIWRLPIAQKPVAAAYPQDATLCREPLQAVGSASESTLDKPRSILRISRPSVIVRGLRRKLPALACALRPAGKRSDGRQAAELARLDATLTELDPTAVAPRIPADRHAIAAARLREIGSLSGCGPAVYRLLPALAAAAEPMTIAELADLVGCSNDSARRCCARLAERGMVLVGTVRTAGRQAKVYYLTAEARTAAAGEHVADASPILAKTIKVGAESIQRAQAKIDAERLFMADARQQAQAFGVSTPAMMAGIRAQIRRMAAAERDADLSMAHSPIIADARRKARRDTMTAVQHRRTAERCGLAWTMNAQAVPA